MFKQGLVNVPITIGDLFHITFPYLLEMKYPQELGDVKHWDIYQPLLNRHFGRLTPPQRAARRQANPAAAAYGCEERTKRPGPRGNGPWFMKTRDN